MVKTSCTGMTLRRTGRLKRSMLGNLLEASGERVFEGG